MSSSPSRVDKQWQTRSLAGYATEAIFGTLNHYGVALDQPGFEALVKEKFPLEIVESWGGQWKGTGQFAPFPAAAAQELWKRLAGGAVQPMDLALSVVELVKSGGDPTAFDATEALLPKLPAAERRERFMSEALLLLRGVMEAFDQMGEQLAKASKLPEAERFVSLEESLFPVRAGVARAMVQAAKGDKPGAVAALTGIVNDKTRDEFARLGAVDALIHLEHEAAAVDTALELLEKGLEVHDHELMDFAFARVQALEQFLEKSGTPEQLMKLDAVLERVEGHHHDH